MSEEKVGAVDLIMESLLSPNTFGLCEDAEQRARGAVMDSISDQSCVCCELYEIKPEHFSPHYKSLEELVEYVVEYSELVDSPVHGYRHWMGVYRNAIMIAEMAKLHKIEPYQDSYLFDFTACAMLFALFHDCRRVGEGYDITHGVFGSQALLSYSYYREDSHLMTEWAVAAFACNAHTVVGEQRTHPYLDRIRDFHMMDLEDKPAETLKAAVGMCLDADRYELMRLGIMPDVRYLYHQGCYIRMMNLLKDNKVYRS